MQTIKLYVAAAETLGTVKDAVNAKKADPPTFVKGSEILLKLRLFANASGEEPYPIESLAEVVAWNFVMDSDFAEATAHKIVADNAAITVSSVTDTINEIPRNYTELQIPITETNTEELAAWLGTDEKKSGLNAELIGANASGKEIFVLQIKNFTVRNRISSAGDPVAIDPDYLTAVQVRSLIAAGLILQFSGDAKNWHDLQLESDHYFRIRSASDANAAWSSAIQLAAGKKGEAGKDAFCYVAYAVDAAGTDFSLIPSEYLPYRAEIHTETEIPSPTLEDFKDAVWLKYIGSDGEGVGDMLQSVYDPDGDGIIDRAASAASADAVAWDAVTKKPETYAPAAHRHAVADLADPVRLLVYEMDRIDRLILTKPVICSSGVNYSGEIALNFPAGIFTDEEMETVYSPVSGELLTWELHFPCSVAVSAITTGSESCAVEGVNLPESLPLIDGEKTRHVFTVRARYSENAVGNIVYLVNYAYSCKE